LELEEQLAGRIQLNGARDIENRRRGVRGEAEDIPSGGGVRPQDEIGHTDRINASGLAGRTDAGSANCQGASAT
jgi:hypothetical protein